MTISTSILRYGNKDLSRQIIKKHVITSSGQLTSHINKERYYILIHGGAWRDPNNTCSDFDQFATLFNNAFIKENERIIFYSIDYELSNNKYGKFPEVLEECLKCLNVIHEDSKMNNQVETKDIEFCIVGHSVGSTLITQIIEYENIFNLMNIEIDNIILPKINKAIFLDGIYNIGLLLNEYPDYEFFVVDEFGSRDNAIKYCNCISNGNNHNIRYDDIIQQYNKLDKILVVHSLTDELLSLKQPENFLNWLVKNGINRNKVENIYKNFGKHNNVYISEEVAKIIYEF